jgi:hypothetical protein
MMHFTHTCMCSNSNYVCRYSRESLQCSGRAEVKIYSRCGDCARFYVLQLRHDYDMSSSTFVWYVIPKEWCNVNTSGICQSDANVRLTSPQGMLRLLESELTSCRRAKVIPVCVATQVTSSAKCARQGDQAPFVREERHHAAKNHCTRPRKRWSHGNECTWCLSAGN